MNDVDVEQIKHQAEIAMDEADVIVCVWQGWNAGDRTKTRW